MRIVKLSIPKSPYVTSLAVTASYLLFYTAYDKVKKTLVIKNLTDLVSLNRGLDWTLLELNKAISLSGMTTMLLAFLPQFQEQGNILYIILSTVLYFYCCTRPRIALDFNEYALDAYSVLIV